MNEFTLHDRLVGYGLWGKITATSFEQIDFFNQG